MTTNHDAILPVEQVMAAGLKRISSLVDQHGITSPEVFSACERWGSILDDVNHPDSTCRWCGQPVAHNHNMGWWYHKDDKGGTRACLTHAGAQAEPQRTITDPEKDRVIQGSVKPFQLKGTVTGRLSQEYGSGPGALQPNVFGPGAESDMQKRLNDAERDFQNSFKPRKIGDNPQA